MTALHDVEHGIIDTVAEEPLFGEDRDAVLDQLVDRLGLQPGNSSDLIHSRTTADIALGVLVMNGAIAQGIGEHGLMEFHMSKKNDRYDADSPIRPEDIFAAEDLDIHAVEDLVERLTTQEKMPEVEAIELCRELVHAIEKVQKNLDNLI